MALRLHRSDHLPWLFLSERGQPLTRSSVQYLVRVAAERVGLLNVHPHTLRHSYGDYILYKRTNLRTIGLPRPSGSAPYRALQVAGRRFEGLW